MQTENFLHITISSPCVSNACEIDSARDAKVDIDGEKPPREKNLKTKMSCHKRKSFCQPQKIKRNKVKVTHFPQF